jgi:hypothetical protein
MTVRDIKLHIFKFFRPLIKAPDLSSKISECKDRNISPEKILDEEYKFFFETEANRSSSYEAMNPLY